MVWGLFKRQMCVGCVGKENLLCDAELSCVIALLADACSITPLEIYFSISEFNGSSCLLYSGFLSLSKPLSWMSTSYATLDCKESQTSVNFHVWAGWISLQIYNFPQELSCTWCYLLEEVKMGWHLFQCEHRKIFSSCSELSDG